MVASSRPARPWQPPGWSRWTLAGEGRARAAQRHPDDGRAGRAVPGRRGPPGPHRERRGSAVGRGAARHGRRVRRGLPAGATASRAGRGRGRAAPPPARQRSAAGPPRLHPQGPGPVLAPLRPAGARRRARCARSAPARARHRAQLGDRQPARLPRRRGRRRGRHRDRRRAGHQRRQLPRRAAGAGPRLREARDRRARLDQRASDGVARGSAAERRALRRSSRRHRASSRG